MLMTEVGRERQSRFELWRINRNGLLTAATSYNSKNRRCGTREEGGRTTDVAEKKKFTRFIHPPHNVEVSTNHHL